ncbi:uncharacterized protein LOC114874228 isoform X2 [Osmia bicornis bicornis]|uniref:uncharacterized protein LOC114874228 isoform X2 n=1 Tax=Osmia bicornis bicornis TaxID=1437191 RepID=UPI0010F5DBB9|nr:uncharacterized protein LOC114874228 isoform X2 [Osmia bicornis bicornis]
MDRFLHFVLLFAVLPFAIRGAIEEGGCECAVFPAGSSVSIIERPLQYNVTCNSEGEARCQLLCVALAQSGRDKAPQMICEKVNAHVENLEVAVYSKICNAINWKFTGLKNSDLICCHEGKPIPCSGSLSIINDWMDSITPLNPCHRLIT